MDHAQRDRGATVFITYNGLLDPLGPSQILPYLEVLNRSWRVHILSFERAARLADRTALRSMEQRLAHQQIVWHRLRYHKSPSLLATTFDLMMGCVTLRRLLWNEPLALIHARGYLPMSIALQTTRKVPLLFDIRGLQPEEYVDGGVWKEGELKWQLAKRAERKFFRNAAAAVVLTENIKPYVVDCFAREGRAPPIETIPCCVDLQRFVFDSSQRLLRRKQLGVEGDRPLLVYSGSIGTWYLVDEMARFVRFFRERGGNDAHVLWLVNNDRATVVASCRGVGLPEDRVHIVEASSEDIPAWLSAADAGLALIKPSFSKRSSSPTKYAEYLAMGLPLVISRGVGDGAALAEQDVAVALTSFDDAALSEGAARLLRLVGQPRDRYRDLARSSFDLQTVAAPLYRKLYDSLASR